VTSRWLALAVLGLAACAGTAATAPIGVTIIDGYDWSVPPGVAARPDSGFYSEEAAPALDVDVHVLDLTWRQLEPTPGVIRKDTLGHAQGLDFGSWNDQRVDGGRYWVRLWMSGVDWAPPWLIAKCGVAPISGADELGERHLPLWNPCVWSAARDLFRRVFVDEGVLADPDFVLAYVPGGFTWGELDFDTVDRAVRADGLTFAVFHAWFTQMVADLVAIGGAHAGQLVYTGEDYPYSGFGVADDLLARDAVAAGLGIRSGITEVANNHLSDVPAYGAHIGPDGHVEIDEDWVLRKPGRVSAAENECYNHCGYTTADAEELAYAIRTSNWKALQLRVSWLYVVPNDSYLADYADHWRWVRAELGRTVADAFDGWVVLREAEDRYWQYEDGLQWDGKPWVKNLERFVVQRDVLPDGISARGSEVRDRVLDPHDGMAYEGRRTDGAFGGTSLYFAVEPRWLSGVHDLEVDVAFLDGACGRWHLGYMTARGPATAGPIACTGTNRVRTARIRLVDADLRGALPGKTDLAVVRDTAADVEVRYLRVVRR
jgi:hypothetical protein